MQDQGTTHLQEVQEDLDIRAQAQQVKLLHLAAKEISLCIKDYAFRFVKAVCTSWMTIWQP